MKGEIKIGGRAHKNDMRSTQNWVGVLNIKATNEGDQYIMAAIARALFYGDRAKGLKTAIVKEAERCRRDHAKLVEQRKG